MKRCPVCHKLFEPFNPTIQEFCSVECRIKNQKKKENQKKYSLAEIRIRASENFKILHKQKQHARELGLTLGQYLGYVQMGLNPEDFRKEVFDEPYYYKI